MMKHFRALFPIVLCLFLTACLSPANPSDLAQASPVPATATKTARPSATPTYTPSPSPTLPSLTPSPIPLPTTPVPSLTPYTVPTLVTYFAPLPIEDSEPYPDPPPASLRILYAVDNRLILWRNGGSLPVIDEPVAPAGEPAIFRLSQDGEMIAYMREGALWTVRSDGSENQMRLDSTLYAQHPNLDWIPESRLILLNDHEIFDAESGERWSFIDAERAGKVYPSPDGKLLAIVTPDHISTVRVSGADFRTRLTIPALCSPTQTAYYPVPVWSSDSSRMLVPIPDQQAFCTDSPQPSTIWSIPVGEGEASIAGTIPFSRSVFIASNLAQAIIDDLSFSETLNSQSTQISYVDLASGAVAPVWNEMGATLMGWTPDSLHFFYYSQLARVFVMGDLAGAVQQITLPTNAAMLKWIDGERFLYTRNQTIYMGIPGWTERWIADLGKNDTQGIFNIDFANP
jgi:hypothetical protein